MGFNPFIDDAPIENPEEWIGDQSVIGQLKNCVSKSKTCTYILGPEGSGKTSLLRTTFTPEYKREMAKTKKKLIYSADLSTRSDGDDLCKYLADRLEDSLNNLIRDKELLEEMKEDIGESNTTSGITRLQNMIEKLHDNWGYFIIIVMDYFELFTMSEHVTQEHHDCLRSLIESGCIQCIVAINYDLSKDSLPSDIRGSYFLQKFTNSIEMEFFGQEDVEAYLRIKQEDGPVYITEDMQLRIYQLSGGIPKFVHLLAKHIYENGMNNQGTVNVGEAVKTARVQCERLMDGWCKVLTEEQIKVLQTIAAQCTSNKEYGYYDFTGSGVAVETAVASLLHRGLLKKYVFQDKNGHLVSQDYLVQFNSLLFQKYCIESKMLEAAKQNPLRKIEEKRNEKQISATTVVIEGNVYEAGAIHDAKNIQISHLEYHNGLTATEFLQMLSESGSQEELGLLIGKRLQDHIENGLDRKSIQQAIECSGEDEVDHDNMVDQAFYDAGQKLFQDVEVDEYDDIIDVSEAELQTLDDRFAMARKRIHQDLSDEMLEKQGERCQFYIKMAVVVEDALSLPGIEFDDYSAQLILYGKVVEQALRDNLFKSFHAIPELAEFRLGAGVKNNFAHMDGSKAFIGNFTHLISEKTKSLADICAGISLAAYPGTKPDDWNRWWKNLANEINRARTIRNMAGHADNSKSPGKSELQEMYQLLVGDDAVLGIINKLLIGKDMCFHYVVPEISRAEAEKLLGKKFEMNCMKEKSNGGIRGKLTGYGYEVNVSPRKVRRFREENRIGDTCLEDRTFLVTILEFKHDTERDYLVAEIASEIAGS